MPHCVVSTPVQGAQQVHKSGAFTAQYVFIHPPDYVELERRLR